MPILFAIIASIALSTWLSVREWVINPDAICYLQSASKMATGLHPAMQLCDQASWPFYSFLIYEISALTHLSVQTAAYTLNGFFSLISVLSFMAIIRFIDKTPRILWFAALTILLAHEFNSVRQYIVRDHGFWAFYLLSFYFLLQYFKTYQFRFAICWNISLVFATLFRVEGAVFLLLTPFAALFDWRINGINRCASFIKLYFVTILMFFALLIAVILHQQLNISRLQEVEFQFLHGGGAVLQHLTQMKMNLATYVLSPDSYDEAGVVLIAMLVGWYIYGVLTNLSFIYAILLVYAMDKKLLKNGNHMLVITTYIVINVLITAGFLLEHLFLSKRYLIALSLVLMIWAPLALNDLYERRVERRWAFALAIFLMFFTAIGGIIDFGYSKEYIHDAGTWLADNSKTATKIYANDFQLMYYSHHFGDELFETARNYLKPDVIAQNHWQDYEILAIRINKKDINKKNAVTQQITYPLVKVFQNKRGDQVRIYRRAES